MCVASRTNEEKPNSLVEIGSGRGIMYHGFERFASDWSCFEISMARPKMWAVGGCKAACSRYGRSELV